MIGWSLGLLAACCVLVGTLAAGAWSVVGQQPGNPAGVGLLAASAFAAGCWTGRRRPSEGTEAGAAPELAAARREVQAARRELESLHSSVGHDLRSPVGAVLNFATVLELDHGDRLDEEGRQVVRGIRRSAEAGLALLDALSRLSGVARAPLRVAALDVEPLVRRAFAEARPGGPRVPLVVEALPPRVVADPELLRTAFRELFDNALKFSEGRPSPHVTVGGRRDLDGTLVYWVTDNGVGFDMRFASKLFGVFERLHARDAFAGAGVGLAMVRKIAERHGGRVWAEAEPEGGARVFLALPERQEAACSP